MENEEWRDVPSVPRMMASSLGRIRLNPYTRVLRNGGSWDVTPKPRIGTEQKSATGRKGVPKRRLAHFTQLNKCFIVARLVCEAFHGPATKAKPITMHLDEDPSNNKQDNLKWGTQRENLNMPKAQAAFKRRVGDKSPTRIHLANKLKEQAKEKL